MMPSKFDNMISGEENYEFNTPVVSLTEGLPISELLSKHHTEFEVRADEDDEYVGVNSAESCFNFDQLEKVVNLDVIDFDQSDNDDSSPFDKYRRKMHNLREDGKVKKYVVKEGRGPLVPDNCLVYIRYQAYVEYEEVPYDSTLWQCDGRADYPVPINLGKGQLLPGLHEGVLTMKKGEKAEFLVHPDLAYGKLGCPPRIPQEATILFIVEVDRFVDCGDIQTNNDDLSMDERNEYCNVHKIAKAHYLLANDQFNKQNYAAAASKYKQVINMMHNARLANEEEERERNQFLIKNYTNACVCYHKLKNYKRVCSMASDAIRVSESEVLKNSKLLYFWGYAKMMLGDYDGARKHLLASKKLNPLQTEIADALKDLEKKKHDAKQHEKIMMRKAFSFNKPAQAKIKEISEDEERFWNEMKIQLQEFKNNPNKESLTLKDHFTGEEEKTCLQLAKDLGLYARVADGKERVIRVNKPAEM